MTEEEAKQRWCPFARVGGPMQTEAEGTSYNRWPGADGSVEGMLSASSTALCIGSACMAWRWNEKPKYIRDDDQGRCGLAGQP